MLSNILRSSAAPSFSASQTDTCEEYYPPPSYMVPCPTSEPLEVDHFQQGQSAFVNLYPYQAPQFPVVGGLGEYGNQYPYCPPCLALPFPPLSPFSSPPHSRTPPAAPGIQTNHTRPFHEGKDEVVEPYPIQPQHDSFQEQDARLGTEVLKVPLPFEETFADIWT